jgi:hypothetical protein
MAKGVHLHQFDIIQNLDLTYIRTQREKQNYIYTLPPLQNLHLKPFFVIYFFTLPPVRKQR